jgi:hypothetical protein
MVLLLLSPRLGHPGGDPDRFVAAVRGAGPRCLRRASCDGVQHVPRAHGQQSVSAACVVCVLCVCIMLCAFGLSRCRLGNVTCVCAISCQTIVFEQVLWVSAPVVCCFNCVDV